MSVPKWLAELPSTNARIVTTLGMAVGTTTFLLALMAQGIDLPEGTVAIIYAYLATQGGFDYAQFKAKRETYQPAPPAPPDVEDAAAVQSAPPAAAAAPPSAQAAPADAGHYQPATVPADGTEEG